MLYLLHFDKPHEHARHYLGCTSSLHNRLKQHANGHGACLTKALFDCGEEWILAAVLIPAKTPNGGSREAFDLERVAKARHNGGLYCPQCNPNAISPPGTIFYPPELTCIPTTSKELRTCTSTPKMES